MKAADRRYAYECEVGRPPARLPADDPLAWQWDPRLSRQAKLERTLQQEPPGQVVPAQLGLTSG